MWLSVVAVTVIAVVTMCEGHSLRFQPEKPMFDMLSDEEINYINSIQTTWKARRNFNQSQAAQVLRKLGVRKHPEPKRVLPVKKMPVGIEIPENFDPRTKWPFCKSLNEIRDQGDCGSCWAFGAVESMTDRMCIFSGGKYTPHISAEDVTTCCRDCGYGCDGGDPTSAWDYWVDSGIVTGGEYGSNEGCQPYELQPCDHHVYGHLPPCSSDVSPTPQCSSQCRGGYNKTYQQDKTYGQDVYTVVGPVCMQEELLANGPFEVTFEVYSDFLSYMSGIYKHVTGDYLGMHAVKMMGWGLDAGVPYWLVANSWNTDWGDNGYFKIMRGLDMCRIEEQPVAGTPSY